LIQNSVVIYLRTVIERKNNYNVNKKHFGSSCEKGKVQKMRIRPKSETGGLHFVISNIAPKYEKNRRRETKIRV
jgi:hypothetical protein